MQRKMQSEDSKSSFYGSLSVTEEKFNLYKVTLQDTEEIKNYLSKTSNVWLALEDVDLRHGRILRDFLKKEKCLAINKIPFLAAHEILWHHQIAEKRLNDVIQ